MGSVKGTLKPMMPSASTEPNREPSLLFVAVESQGKCSKGAGRRLGKDYLTHLLLQYNPDVVLFKICTLTVSNAKGLLSTIVALESSFLMIRWGHREREFCR
ncbi:hypothetical protein MUK42_33289 [Musa troglodytarum]|uniref:Uncharacterized protein n=1 Tax=Musa troglodytarum TaxID=320322 RepID=A0A9E7KZL6_9LILI|nr:hypothetical protein MUK42_33289 [Musa troglodytarum]